MTLAGQTLLHRGNAAIRGATTEGAVFNHSAARWSGAQAWCLAGDPTVGGSQSVITVGGGAYGSADSGGSRR